jgi:hypothetical protein
MNRNWQEEIDVAVGPDNGFTPGNADQGQPTHFLPRRNRFVFRVPVPQSFSDKDELVWTITTKGKTEKAFASLRPDYKVDDVVKASETGALGAGTSSPKVRANKAPIVKVDGETTRTVKVGQRLSITTLVTDDGVLLVETLAATTSVTSGSNWTAFISSGISVSYLVGRVKDQNWRDEDQEAVWHPTP